MNEVLEWGQTLSPVMQAFIATLFTWFVTALGAAVVFFFKTINRKVLDGMMGFAAGVMISAAFWSLLLPAYKHATAMEYNVSSHLVFGFLSGAAFLLIFDKTIPHLHIGFPRKRAEGPSTKWNRSILLVLAITLHNIPEGLAIGIAFGALAHDMSGASFTGAVALAIGIAVQNFPEGLSVSAPLRRDGMSRLKSFWYGQLSGAVEPIAGVVGALAVLMIEPLLPFAMAFAAGAMIFVVVEELIPESQLHGNADISTIGAIVGFALMMWLDVALGQ